MQVNSFQLDQLDQLGHAGGVAKRSVAVMYQPQLWPGGELLGIADWFPAAGWSRPMMLGLIATVGIYGYQREKREKQKDLLAFADVARYRFAEEAKRIHQERDREHEEKIQADRDRIRAIEERNRDLEKAKQSARNDRIKRLRPPS